MVPSLDPPADLRSCAFTIQAGVTLPGTDGEIRLKALDLDEYFLGSIRSPFHEEPDSFDKSDISPVARDYPGAV